MTNLVLIGLITAVGFAGLVYWRLLIALKHDRATLKKDQDLLGEKESIMVEKATQVIQRMKLDAQKTLDQEKQAQSKLGDEQTRLLKQQQHTVATELAKLDQQKATLAAQNNKLNQRDLVLSNREIALDAREKALEEQYAFLAQCTAEEAKAIVLEKAEEDAANLVGQRIKAASKRATKQAKEAAKELIISAVQRSAVQIIGETSTTTITLPNEDLKGRIIGKEGRNIRSFELITGCDIIVDDAPDEVVLSCFDPIRREIGKMALTALVTDGRINPARIEDVVQTSKKELDARIIEIGQAAVDELQLTLHPKLVALVGRLNYRTSYGQNVLKHSVEAAHIAGNLATELGADSNLAKRGALLHDIGKALDFESTGTHVTIGDTVCRKYGESDVVINCINAHHEDEAPSTLEAKLVMIADAVSSSRPGARRESIEKYIERLTQLESIAKLFNGVKKVYAIQAGREVRVLVQPDKVTDNRMYKLARDIARRIESEVDYPGEVTVSLIRETRAYSTAK